MSMSGSEFRTYVLEPFKRTDKDTELYNAATDAVSDMARKFSFSELEIEIPTTDSISVLGDYRIDLETNFGLLVAEVVVVDGNSSRQLEMVSKSEFDRLYPNPAATDVDRTKPIHACVFAGKLHFGPVPDSVSYTYKVSYSSKLTAVITSVTAAVPFSGLATRECLRFYTLEKLYGLLENPELEAKYKMRGDGAFREIVDEEKRKRKSTIITVYQGV